MKIRILGCGTSFGVPRIGRDWGRCDPNEPKNRRTRSSILVESGGTRLLVDCGPDLRQQLLDADVGDLDAVVLTHDHADHCHGIDELRAISQQREAAIPLYARADVLDRLASRFAYAFEGGGFYKPVVRGEALQGSIDFATCRLGFVDQPHGGITSLGIRLDEGRSSAAYAIDFNAMTDEMAALYQGVGVLISDCLQRRPHPTHAHLDAVVGWARDLSVGALYLTHMNNSMDYAELIRELPDWAAPAFDGLEIEP